MHTEVVGIESGINDTVNAIISNMKRGGNFLDRARCMSLLAHAYQLQNSNVHTLMVALRQLNTVEEAEEDIHEVLVTKEILLQ